MNESNGWILTDMSDNGSDVPDDVSFLTRNFFKNFTPIYRGQQIWLKHLVQVDTHQSETLYIMKFSTGSEINMCLNLNQMLHSNVIQP